MTTTSLTGPMVVVGQPVALTGMPPSDYNADLAPSLMWGGSGLLDPRAPNQASGASSSPMFYGFLGNSRIPLIDQVPFTITANNIAASQVPVAGTAMTLRSSSANGVTILAAATVIPPSFTSLAAGTLALDTAPGTVYYGTSGNVRLYDPTKAIARNVRFISTADESAATAVIRGNDVYGYAMTETVTLANNGTASGAKAFKFIRSITPAGTLSGTAITVGTGDVIGLPLRVDKWGYIQIYYAATNATLIAAATGFTAAVTSTATATTGDVRGTYALQTASNNSIRLVVFAQPEIANLGTTAGLFGVAQFSS